jgi:hypothetical protein
MFTTTKSSTPRISRKIQRARSIEYVATRDVGSGKNQPAGHLLALDVFTNHIVHLLSVCVGYVNPKRRMTMLTWRIELPAYYTR